MTLFRSRIEDRVPTIRDLRGERDVLRSLRREVDRDVGAQRMRDRLQRLAETRAARQRHLVDRKSTRLNSSHVETSYAVFCLKKKTITNSFLQIRNCFIIPTPFAICFSSHFITLCLTI